MSLKNFIIVAWHSSEASSPVLVFSVLYCAISLNSVCTYKEKFSSICQKIFDFGLVKHEERMKEADTFLECLNDAMVENKAQATKSIDEFMEYKKKVRFNLNYNMKSMYTYNIFRWGSVGHFRNIVRSISGFKQIRNKTWGHSLTIDQLIRTSSLV